MKGKMKKCPAGKMYDMKLKKCVTRKGDLNKDGKMSSYETRRSNAIKNAMAKSKKKKSFPKFGTKKSSYA